MLVTKLTGVLLSKADTGHFCAKGGWKVMDGKGRDSEMRELG